MTSIRNNVYYVALVVPLQTVLALGLALVVNQPAAQGQDASSAPRSTSRR